MWQVPYMYRCSLKIRMLFFTYFSTANFYIFFHSKYHTILIITDIKYWFSFIVFLLKTYFDSLFIFIFLNKFSFL